MFVILGKKKKLPSLLRTDFKDKDALFTPPVMYTMAMDPNPGPGKGAVRLVVDEAGKKTRYFYTTWIPSLGKSLESASERGGIFSPHPGPNMLAAKRFDSQKG